MDYNGREFWDGPVALTASAQRFHRAADITSPYDNHLLDLTVFLDCRNDESSIAETLDTVVEAMKVAGHSYEIVIIDDASQDRSVEVARGYMDGHPEVNIVLRVNKRPKGLAQNYIDAAFIGCGKYFRLVDADSHESLEIMAEICGALGEADIIVPYYVSSLQSNRPNRFLSDAYTRLLNAITGNSISYYNGNPMHLRCNVLRWHNDATGAAFQAGLLCRLLALGFTCKQVPCRSAARPYTPVTLANVLSALQLVLGVLVRRVGKSV